MPVPSEETLESEIGFDYSYDIDYSYGIVTGIDKNKIIASVGETESTGQSATVAVSGTVTIPTSVGETESEGQSATAAPGTVALPASVGQTESEGQEATAVPGTATLTASTGVTESEGQSATITTPAWQFDGVPIETVTGETLDYKTLTLSFRTSNTTRDTYLAPLRSGLGKFDVVDQSDGGYQVVNRSSQAITVLPPESRQPPRISGTFYPLEYADRFADQSGEVYQVDLTLQRNASRDEISPAVSDTRASDEWSFAINNQSVATKKVDANIRQDTGGEPDIDAAELTVLPSATQAEAVESAATELGSVSVRQVPDGQNVAEDNNANNRSTVDVTTPDGSDAIPAGNYTVRDWSSEWLSEKAQRLRMLLLKK